MPKTDADKITELDYNTLQDDINTIMGTPAGTTETTATGYNQTLLSSQISAGNKITEVQWDNLRTDITKAYTHQFGVAPTITNVSTSSLISASVFNQYETLISTVSSDPNRYTVGTGQWTTATGLTGTLASGWNGVQYLQFTATFASSNERKAFFNAGGAINIVGSIAYTGTEAKTLDWQTMFTNLGTVVFNYKETTSGAGTDTTGNYDVTTTTWQSLASGVGTSPYAENDILVDVRQNSASQLEFRVTLRDDDAGDRPVPSPPPPYGPLVDENVKGTTTITVTSKKPNGTSVSVPAPVMASASGNTFTIA